jgi:hypothetical protein
MAGEIRRFSTPLLDAGQQPDAAVLGISHFSKGTARREVTKRVTGALAFGALARVVLAAAKRSDADGGGAVNPMQLKPRPNQLKKSGLRLIQISRSPRARE